MEKRNLRNLKDRYLIDDIRLNNDNESLNELHDRYKNMYYKQAHRFDNFFKINNIRLSDALNESHYVIYDSARTFDETKGIKYITWLGSKTKFYFLNKSNDKDKSYGLLDFKDSERELDELSNSAQRENKKNHCLVYSDAMSVLRKCSDKRVVEIFEKRYNPNSRKTPTWRNISKDFDLSAQTVINLHAKGIDFLRKRMKNFI
tara:strand:- start:17 stop:625 length:609 start_codon:yes stop_codon:yes gene_type:complete